MEVTPEIVFLLVSIAVPMLIVLAVGMFRGYNIHFTKHRIHEQDEDKD